ncbi:Protein O-linked-mannose beta-1,4-N-acetylglucosaminyltransferase 2 [Gonapodya sp. JEL0774]|nr:Protein O-linked-mannose beta-1,4-N-acetylglucosaminyltransferase 2 [Gonapodya sp. JEL0774]
MELPLEVETAGLRVTVRHFSRLPPSSVWCYSDPSSTPLTALQSRICRFRNLYYSSSRDAWFTVLGRDSTRKNVPKTSPRSAAIELSSVAYHKQFWWDWDEVEDNIFEEVPEVRVVGVTTAIFARFNPGNVMHVLHDDIIALYHTLKQFGPASTDHHQPFSRDVHLVFLDPWPAAGPYSSIWRRFFTYHEPWTATEDLRSNAQHDITLFVDAVVGISKEGTWYQYGFWRPQGPIGRAAKGDGIEWQTEDLFADIAGSQATQTDYAIPGWEEDEVGFRVKEVADWISNQVEPEQNKPGYCLNSTDGPFIVLICRRANRLILNEDEVMEALFKHFDIPVFRLYSEDHSFEEIVKIMRRATIVLGMHGAGLAMSMFAQPLSVVIEMFPYGVRSEMISPYKALAELRGVDMIYKFWENRHSNCTVGHPDRLASHGGINHLPQAQRQQILTSPIQPHICCMDPSWLYHIYQDTTVTVSEIIEQAEIGLRERQSKLARRVPHNFDITLSAPTHLTCLYPTQLEDLPTEHVRITWDPPYNIPSNMWDDVNYLVHVNVRSNGTIGSFYLRGVTSMDLWAYTDLERAQNGWEKLIVVVTANLNNLSMRMSSRRGGRRSPASTDSESPRQQVWRRIAATFLFLALFTGTTAQSFSATLSADVIPGGRPQVAGLAPNFNDAENSGCTVLKHVTQTSTTHTDAHAGIAGMKLAMEDMEFLIDADLINERRYAIVLGTNTNPSCVSTSVYVDTQTCGQYYILKGSWSSLSGCGWAIDVDQVASTILYLYWEDAGSPGGVVGVPVTMKLSTTQTVSYAPNSFTLTSTALSAVQIVNSSGFVENRVRVSFTYELVEHYPLNYSFTGMFTPQGWTDDVIHPSVREVDCGLFDPTVSTLCTVRRTVTTLVPKAICQLQGTFEMDFASNLMAGAIGYTAADYVGHTIAVSINISPPISFCGHSALTYYGTNSTTNSRISTPKSQYNYHELSSYVATLQGVAPTTSDALPVLWQLTAVRVPEMTRWDLVESGIRSRSGLLANVAQDPPVVGQNNTQLTIYLQSFGGTTLNDGMIVLADAGKTVSFNVLPTFRYTKGTIILPQGGTAAMTSATTNNKVVTTVVTTPSVILVTDEVGPMIAQISVTVPSTLKADQLDAGDSVSDGVGGLFGKGGVPAWAIAVAVVGGVLVLVLFTLVLCRHRLRRMSELSYKSTGPMGSFTRAGGFNSWRLRRGASQMEENELSTSKRDAVGGFVKISDDKMVTFGSWRNSKKGSTKSSVKAAPSVLNRSNF